MTDDKSPSTPKPRGNRTSEAELARRVHAITMALVAGMDDSGLVGFCWEKWGVCENTARSYIAIANEGLRATFANDAKREAQKALRRYQDLYYRSWVAKDYRGAVSAQDRICRLLGLWGTMPDCEATCDSLTEFLKTVRAGRYSTLALSDHSG